MTPWGEGEILAADISHSPTRTDQMTSAGVILGTALTSFELFRLDQVGTEMIFLQDVMLPLYLGS